MTRYIRDASDAAAEGLDVPETYVSTLRVQRTGNSDIEDSFAKPAEDIRKMVPEGMSPGFKRSVTNELKKFRRGVDGAESKQLDEQQAYTGYQMFDVVLPKYNLDYLAQLYELSPHHYAAVNAKVANIVGLGYRLIETNKTKREFEDNADNETKTKKARRRLEIHRDEVNEALESFNEEDNFTSTMVKVWRDYEIMGNGYLEIGRKKDGSIGYIGHIPAQTMRVRKRRDGFIQIAGHKLQFFANYGYGMETTNPVSGGRPNEVIHIKKYSPNDSYYGIPDIIAAKQAVAGNEFAARFNLDYFENKAIPKHVIILKGAKLGNKSEQSLLEFFESGLKGQNHRSLYIPLPGDSDDNKVDLSFETIEPGTQDSSFTNYRKANMSDILMVHRVPVTKISITEGASLAVAKDADKTFKEQVCGPEQKMFEKKVNKIIKELTDLLELKLNEMTLTDADTQSKIDERYVKIGVDLPNEVRAERGKAGIPGGNERTDLNAKDKIAQAQAEERTQRERDAARSAGATDSAGAARTPKGEGRTTA